MGKDTGCIILNGIDKVFGTKKVLKEVSLTVPYGAVYGLLGPSGCGKTTTVKIMAGILESSGGQTYVLGDPMPSLYLMGRIGYMAQSDALYQMLTAEENLEFFGSLYGMDKKNLQKRISQVMHLVNLEDHRNKPISAYSGGMKRRLSLAAAILHEPEVLILDEPTVGIDPLLRKSIWDALYEMADSGVTILVTTHVMDEAEKCTRLAMMRDGYLIGEGTPQGLRERTGTQTLEEVFLKYSTGEEDIIDEN